MDLSLKADIRTIVRNYTNQQQLIVLIEEMAELTKEIVKELRRENKDGKALAEEAADVTIMLEQLKVIIGIPSSQFNRLMRYKVNHQLKRIENK